MSDVNIPLYCEDCVNCESDGYVMVGTDETGGGPEESYNCKADRNMSHYWFYKKFCPDFQGYGCY